MFFKNTSFWRIGIRLLVFVKIQFLITSENPCLSWGLKFGCFRFGQGGGLGFLDGGELNFYIDRISK